MQEAVQEKANIVKTEGIVGGKARVEGTRISVVDIVELYTELEYSPEKIATEFSLNLGEVFAALKYYYENPKEIRRKIREKKEFAEKTEKRAA